MKTTIKHAAVFMPCNLFLLTSCHQEELNQEKEDLAEITVECKSLRDFEKQPVLIEQLLPKNNTTTDLEKGNKDGDLYDFKIDSSKVTHVARNGTAFYTMAISRNENEKNTFENLIISDDGDVQRAYLVKYFPDPIYFRKLKNNMHTPYVGGMNFQEIDYNNLTKSMQTERICIRYTQVLCNYKGEEHTAGAKCTPAFIYTRTIQNCFTVIVSSPEPNVIVDLNTGQENGGGGGSSGSAEAPEILTEPIYLFNMRPFINQLSNEQKAWWNDPANANAIQNIGIYLQQNQTDEAQEFAKWAIDYLRTNPSVTMAQFQNWFMSPSQGQDFIYDSSFWNNPANLNFQQQSLPSYNDFLDGFPQNGSGEFLTGADNIFSLVGGDVQQVRLDYPGNQTKNVCALKVSIALNNSGVVVPNIPNQTIEGGGDYAGKYFFLNVRALNNWMRATFGTSNPMMDFLITKITYHLQNRRAGITGKIIQP